MLTVGQREHSCHPGWERHWCDGSNPEDPPAGWYLVDLHCEAGTVWQCECGQVWVADAWPHWKDTNVLMGRITWRHEKRRERRRRLTR